MKNALLLHGTDGNHSVHWFPWLEKELHDLGYDVWLPDLPQADHPNIQRYNDFLLGQSVASANGKVDWGFDRSSIIVGHSSGAVEILGLLNDPRFPDVKVKACFLAGAFKGDLGWDQLTGMVQDFDFERIQRHASKFVFVHSDNDPYCPLDDAKDLCSKLNGKFVLMQGFGHFSTGGNPRLTQFPELLHLIQDEVK